MRRFTRRPQLKTPQRRPFLRFVRVNSTCVAPTTLLFSTLPSCREDNRETLDDFDVGSTRTSDVFSLFAACRTHGGVLFVANFYHPYCLPHSFQESFIFIPDFSGRNSSIVRFVDHTLYLFLFLFFVYTFVRGMQNGFFL